jgi:GAF domain
MHAPAFASFDGVSGGMILDLSEEGFSMGTNDAVENHAQHFPSEIPSENRVLKKGQQVRLEIDLPGPSAQIMPSKLETTGYIAWADALGRAGVRFSDLPEEARRRLNEWLAVNASAPSHTAPKVALAWPGAGMKAGRQDPMSISLEAETGFEKSESARSATVQYEFKSLGTDLSAALRLIGERARSLTRGSSAAIGLEHKGAIICRASVGLGVPALGTKLDVNSGFAGECFRESKALRCDDVELDPRVDLETCRRLGVRSIVAAPLRYERDTIGLLMVVAPEPFNFDEGDVAVVESLAHTVVRNLRQEAV